MKRNLNLIATAASLILLGLSGESYALQDYQDSLVGSGLLSTDNIVEAKAAPVIVKSQRKLISELKPLTMPKLKQLPIPGRPAFETTVQEEVASYGSPSESRLPDAGIPANDGDNSRVPPIIRSTSRQISQAEDVGIIPPVVQASDVRAQYQSQPPIIQPGSRRLTQAEGVGIIPPVVQQDDASQSVQAVAYSPQGSSSRVPQGSATRAPLPQGSATRAPLPQGSATRAPVPTPAGSSSRSSNVQSVVEQPSATDGSPTYFSAGPAIAEQPVLDDRGSGPEVDYSNGPVIEDFGTFGLVSAARSYVHAEALVFTRGDGDISSPNIAALNDFGFGGGLRLTFGRKSESINGTELSILALTDIDEEASITSSPEFGVFEDTQDQSKESDLYSVEYNRVSYGWDVVKTFVGVRYIRFDDSYQLDQVSSTSAFDNFTSLDATNNLFGAHVGGELFYDIGYRWSGSIRGKYGVFLNIYDFDSTNGPSPNGPFSDSPTFSNESNDVTVATAAELNFLAHYQIRTNLRFQAGYNLIFVGNVAGVAENVGIGPSLNGPDVSDGDDVFFHGLSFGLEFYR